MILTLGLDQGRRRKVACKKRQLSGMGCAAAPDIRCEWKLVGSATGHVLSSPDLELVAADKDIQRQDHGTYPTREGDPSSPRRLKTPKEQEAVGGSRTRLRGRGCGLPIDICSSQYLGHLYCGTISRDSGPLGKVERDTPLHLGREEPGNVWSTLCPIRVRMSLQVHTHARLLQDPAPTANLSKECYSPHRRRRS